MSNNIATFNIKFSSNGYDVMKSITAATEGAIGKFAQFTNGVKSIGECAFVLNNIKGAIDNISSSLSSLSQPGAALNASLADLSAISSVSGQALSDIGKAASKTSKEFGVDAAQGVESYKS